MNITISHDSLNIEYPYVAQVDEYDDCNQFVHEAHQQDTMEQWCRDMFDDRIVVGFYTWRFSTEAARTLFILRWL